ncbi:MAG: Qat anti-phage system TatD family nuclease QatD [Alphaproteobacteria bacterium]
MIDFHCHVDLFPDPKAVLAEIEARGMYVLVVTTTPKAWKGTSQLVAGHKRVRVSPGLHPELVAERHTEMPLLCHLVGQSPYVGEVGLDGSPQHKGSYKRQEEVLARVLGECRTLGGRILSIHSRAAASGVLDLIEEHSGLGVPVLHWFSGRPRELDRAISLGCWFSVGPAMTRTKKGRALVEAMPADRVLTETDGPFALAQNKSGSLMPWDVSQAERDLADCWRQEEAEARDTLMSNLRRLTDIANGIPLKPRTVTL